MGNTLGSGCGKRWFYWRRGLILSVLLVVLMYGWCAGQVYYYSLKTLSSDYRGSVAVVLGAAAWHVRPSPVFRERINHAIVLYQSGKVAKLAFTGGRIKPDVMTEAEVALRYALRQGIPAGDVVYENTSRHTYGNLYNIRPLLAAQDLQQVVLVTDPLHMARAIAMARRLGLVAVPSPTPTTRYASAWKKWQFGCQEAWWLFAYYLADWGNSLLDSIGLGSLPDEV